MASTSSDGQGEVPSDGQQGVAQAPELQYPDYYAQHASYQAAQYYQQAQAYSYAL